MAYPSIYDVTYSYTGFQQAQQGISAFPGTQLDADLAGLHGSVSNLALFVTGVLRSDGGLNNGVVSYNSLTSALQSALSALAPAASDGGGISVKAYGASGSSEQTTGTIQAGSKSLTLNPAIYFAKDQGILIFGAGPAPTVGTPTPVSITPTNASGAVYPGTTTYSYKFASRDNAGGLSAATEAHITNGFATLGTYLPELLGITMNVLAWTAGSGTPLGTVVWRSTNGGPYVLLGCFRGTSINDSGLPAQSLVGIPATPPVAPLSRWLATTIVSSGGIRVDLTDVATTGASATLVIHDDTAAINAAMAVNTAIDFPAGVYNVRGLMVPSTVRSITGPGGGAAVITSLAPTADGLGGGVSAAMVNKPFYMSGVSIVAAYTMAFDGFVLYQSARAVISRCEFTGAKALINNACADSLITDCVVPLWWDIGVYDVGGSDTSIIGCRVGAIAAQAGAMGGGLTPAGSGYPFATGIWALSSGHLLMGNTVTPYGGCFGLASQGPNGRVLGNAVKYSGREGLVIGGNTGTYFKATDNDLFWLPAGNGNRSCQDFGISLADDGAHAIFAGEISNNKITNAGFCSIAVFGSGVGVATYADVTIANNVLAGSCQLDNLPFGIGLFGSNVSRILVDTNTHHSPSAFMTWNVAEGNAGAGTPSNNTVNLQLGPPGTAGTTHLVGVGSVDVGARGNLTGVITSVGNVTSITTQSGIGSHIVVDNSPTITTPFFGFGSGAASTIAFGSANTGFQNNVVIYNSGTVSNTGTVAGLSAQLLGVANAYLQIVMQGGASPKAQIASGSDATGGLTITAGAGQLVLTNPFFDFGTPGASHTIVAGSTNTGFQNTHITYNNGTVGNAGTVAASGVELHAGVNCYLQMVVSGGASPTAQIVSGSGMTGGLAIAAGAGPLVLTNPTAAATPAANDNSTKLATTAYHDRLLGAVNGVATLDGGGKLAASQIPATANVATWLATPSSTNLAAAMTDETGSGSLVFGTGPILTTADARGVWTAGATWTLPAHTLGGAISGGGQQINNVVIGSSTPLAGSFTTLTGTSGSHTGMTGLGIRSTGAAFDLTLASTEVLTAGRTLTLTLNDAARTFNMGGNFTIAGATSLPAIAQGDLWYGSATGVISALAKNATATRYISNTGATNNPAWAQIDLTNGVTAILPVANGGTGNAGGAWTTATPTVTPQGGAFTTVFAAARYLIEGKKLTYTVLITITAAGSATGVINITLPGTTPASTGAAFSGVEAATGAACVASVGGGSSTLSIAKYDGTTIIGSGRFVLVSGVMEIQ